MSSQESNNRQRREDLAVFLTGCRSRLQPEDVGLPITLRRRVPGLRREEVAELAGVSSDWYRWFESGRPIRVSFEFVARLANALRLSGNERAWLFRLALPELAAAMEPALRPSSATVLGSVSSLRKVLRRMWSAASLVEVLTTATEAVAAIFKDADTVGAYQRLGAGEWTYPVALTDERLFGRVSDAHSRLRVGLTPEQVDESMLQTALKAPGEVGTFRELLRGTPVMKRCEAALQAEGFKDADCLAAFSSGSGTEATLFVAYLDKPREFSEVDRTLLGAIADVLSLAVKG